MHACMCNVKFSSSILNYIILNYIIIIEWMEKLPVVDETETLQALAPVERCLVIHHVPAGIRITGSQPMCMCRCRADPCACACVGQIYVSVYVHV